MPKHSRLLIVFGLFLIVCGVIGWGVAGFDRRAATAIVSGSVTGLIMIGAGWVAGREAPLWRMVGKYGGMIFAAMFGGVFTWRAVVGWQDVAAGEPKLYVALLLSIMAVASFVVVAILAAPGRNRPAESRGFGTA